MAITPDGRRIYIADHYDSTVTVVRTATGSVLKRIHVAGASALAISPDGSTVYVGGSQTDPATGIPELVTIATVTNTAAAPILLGQRGGVVNAIALPPGGQQAYLALDTAVGGFVLPFRTAARTLGRPIPVAPDPVRIAIARRGGTMYVVSNP
jgi:YVTN family beta-propeller protein